MRDYFNYIYLSTLFNKPIATLEYETYCTDYPDEGWAKILQAGRGISIDYWRPQCVPVKVQLTAVDPKSKTRLWNASVQYLNFPGSSEFVRKIKKAIVDPESINLPLLNQRRQIELSALYDLKINYFQHYGAESHFKVRLVELLSRLGSEFKLDDNTGNTSSVIILHK